MFHPRNLIVAKWNFTRAADVKTAVKDFFADRTPLLHRLLSRVGDTLKAVPASFSRMGNAFTALPTLWGRFSAWLAQPHVYSVIIAWAIAFLVVYIGLSMLGFQPQGVAAGSIAAGLQAWAYGAFTPAGGLFAGLTSLGMLGLAQPVFFVIAVVIASCVAAIVAAIGVGRA
ncbi:MAG: hypothetical protein M1831_004368 [Alyxoria varia]|nr:MAG: hypothetical protein M1831_004368 [Alyxoria varia]